MKNLVIVVLLVVVAIAAYSYVNQPKENVDAVVVEEAVVATTEGSTTVTEETVATETEEVSMITPADMSEEAQAEMYNHIMEYNKCMMQNRLEYHQQGVRVENVADKTLTTCEPHLDALKATLVTNNVNEGLREGMVKTMRQRAARKLMSTIMQSRAGQAAAAANIAPGPVPLPVTP
ncbi:MAG: hypothetical protein PSN44_03205 [Gammaproteobacteria bacterium]|nr:hypothetical protein [Gammaproteobacteria bacterium]